MINIEVDRSRFVCNNKCPTLDVSGSPLLRMHLLKTAAAINLMWKSNVKLREGIWLSTGSC